MCGWSTLLKIFIRIIKKIKVSKIFKCNVIGVRSRLYPFYINFKVINLINKHNNSLLRIPSTGKLILLVLIEFVSIDRIWSDLTSNSSSNEVHSSLSEILDKNGSIRESQTPGILSVLSFVSYISNSLFLPVTPCFIVFLSLLNLSLLKNQS